MSGVVSVEDALLSHLVPERPDSRSLVVAYARIDTPEVSDPRATLLRPDRVWVLSPGQSLAFGRSPRSALHHHPLVEADSSMDPTIPGVAGLIDHEGGQWRLANRTTRQTHRTHVRAAGFTLDLGAGPAVVLRHRLTFASVTGRSRLGGQPASSEHRFMLLRPVGHTAPPPRPMPARAQGDSATRTLTRDLGHAVTLDLRAKRLMAAFAYPELLGLWWRPADRGRMVRRLLGQPLGGDDPNEKALSALRKRLAKATGLPVNGKPGTGAFLELLASARDELAPAMNALHSEYLAATPAPVGA